METQKPTVRALAMLVAFALVCFLTTMFVWREFGGSIPFAPKGYRFHVLFQQGTNLAPNNAVRISGVPVGKVVAVAQRGQLTDATIQLDQQYVPLAADARAILRTKTLLGETFVALTPGTRGGPKLPDGGTLPVSQVQQTKSLDQVLATFDPPTRQAFQHLFGDLSAATAGHGGELNAALGGVQPATYDVNRLLGILDAQRSQVATLIADTGVTLRAVGARQDAIQGLVAAGDRVFSATAADNGAVTSTVRSLPPFLASLRGALADADQTVKLGGPALHELRPAAPLVRPAVAELTSLSPRVRSLLVGLPPVIAAARPGLSAANRLVTSVAGLAPVLDTAGTELVPVVDYLTVFRREILAGMVNLGMDLQASTPAQAGSSASPLHYFRVLFPFNNESLFGAAQREPSNRHNPYFAPGGQDLLASGLRAFSCANTSNPATVPVVSSGTSPPCLTQSPWDFRGATRSYPHVERSAP